MGSVNQTPKQGQFMRDDIQYANFAKQLGFQAVSKSNLNRLIETPYTDGDPIPSTSLSFTIGDVRVWSVRGGWRFADYSGGKVTNHSEIYSDLSVCLHSAAKFHASVTETHNGK